VAHGFEVFFLECCRGDPPGGEDITGLLLDWGSGNREALDKLTPLVYGELRQLAKRQIRGERPEHTLQSTATVHEAYLKLIDQQRHVLTRRITLNVCSNPHASL
jgi:hypothetical protein